MPIHLLHHRDRAVAEQLRDIEQRRPALEHPACEGAPAVVQGEARHADVITGSLDLAVQVVHHPGRAVRPLFKGEVVHGLMKPVLGRFDLAPRRPLRYRQKLDPSRRQKQQPRVRVVARCLQHLLTLRSVAEAAGISSQGVLVIEMGRSEPLISTVEQLAVALNVAPGWLAFGEGEAPESLDEAPKWHASERRPD